MIPERLRPYLRKSAKSAGSLFTAFVILAIFGAGTRSATGSVRYKDKVVITQTVEN